MTDEAAEMGHMTKAPADVRSTTTKSKRRQTAKDIHHAEKLGAAAEIQIVPQQEPGNKRTHYVFMST